jgi:hypothetical protein
MPAPITTYLMSFLGMGVAALSARVLFSFVDHLDPLQTDLPKEKPTAPEHIAA